MGKRKSRGSELRVERRPTSPEAGKSWSGEWPEFSSSSSSSSVSCVFTVDPEEDVKDSNALETKAMELVGCPRCFMYVMLSEVDPKCPKCKTTVFLEFFKDQNFKTDN